MNILIVEDHRLVADALQVILAEVNDKVRITPCYSTQHALSIIDSDKHFDLILTDLFMPGIDGIGLLAGLRNRTKCIPVVVVSSSDENKHIQSAIENGASGYIPKTLPAIEMINGIRKVLAGSRFFPESYFALDNQLLRDETAHNCRTNSGSAPGQKQMQVLQLMADGKSNKQISHIVGITEATVKYHTSQLFKLLNVKNRTSCVREALQRGLIGGFDEVTESVTKSATP